MITGWELCPQLTRRHINTTRYLLLDMRDRKGWKALGYESFVEYGEKELNFGSTHLYRLAESAEISLQLGYSPIGEKAPPETHLRPLTAVPEDVRKQIWDEATKKAEADGVGNSDTLAIRVAWNPMGCRNCTPPETRNPDRRMADRGLYLRLAQYLVC